MALTRKNETFAVLSIIDAATVHGVLAFSITDSEDVTNEETTRTDIRGFHNILLDTLTDEQLDTLKKMIEENHAEIKNQLEKWNVEISELNNEQQKTLQTIIEKNRTEVEAHLKEWSIEIPMQHNPIGWQNSLTEDQREKLQTMRKKYLDSVKAKLKKWGIEVPKLDGGMEFHEICTRGFSIFKP